MHLTPLHRSHLVLSWWTTFVVEIVIKYFAERSYCVFVSPRFVRVSVCGEGSPARRGATLSMNVSGVDVTYPMFSRIWRCFIMFHF